MTQTVFDNAMTAHVWAQMRQPWGRNHNWNFFFKGRTLYSYGPHYVVGYIVGDADHGPRAWLVNAGSSYSVSTARHVSEARRAVPGYVHHVPGLTELVRALETARRMTTARERVAYVAKQMSGDYQIEWPGERPAAAILRALGASEGEAARRAAAGQKRHDKAQADASAKAARRELDQNAGVAKVLSRYDPESSYREARAKLARSAGPDVDRWQAARLESEVAEEAKEAHRAAKAAKAKGWTQLAKAARGHQSAIRRAIREFEAGRERAGYRAAVRCAIAGVRSYAGDVQAMAGTSYGRDSRQLDNLARKADELRAQLWAIARSPFAGASWGVGPLGRFSALAQQADATAAELRTEAGAARYAEEREARELWRAGQGSSWTRLSCEQGGALVRAEGIERDDSGAITGGTLRTSWGASVPLAHAVKAFRFLKLCRDAGRDWHANGHCIRVGHFRVDSVTAAGDFVAGCHRFYWPEIARCAADLGLADIAPADEALELSRGAN